MLIVDAENRDLLHECRVGRGASSSSHMIFADDEFLFFHSTIDECRTMKNILADYEEASRQAINYDKSALMCSSNVAPELHNAMSCILGVASHLNT